MSGSLGRTPGGGAHPFSWRTLMAMILVVTATVGILQLATCGLPRLIGAPKAPTTTISGPKKPGKVATKPLTPAEQLRKERAARKAAEAKVRELRKALRAKAASRRPAAPPIQRHVHSGTVRVEVITPTYPIIPEPARR